MVSWIEWCKCHRRILATRQLKEGMPCAACQEEEKRKQKEETLKGEKNERNNKIVHSRNG